METTRTVKDDLVTFKHHLVLDESAKSPPKDDPLWELVGETGDLSLVGYQEGGGVLKLPCHAGTHHHADDDHIFTATSGAHVNAGVYQAFELASDKVHFRHHVKPGVAVAAGQKLCLIFHLRVGMPEPPNKDAKVGAQAIVEVKEFPVETT